MRQNLAIILFVVLSGAAINGHAADESLVVSAASSLKDAFIEAGKVFERDHPKTRIAFNFASSNQLASQIEQGAPVDVFASADMSHIRRLAGKNLVASNTVLAQNRLIVIVSKKSRIKIETLGDLSNKGVRLIMSARQVPVGDYVRQFIKKAEKSGTYGADYSARVMGNVVSEEPDARMIAMKVALGEGDAGIVYASDVSGDVRNKVNTIAIAEHLNVTADYGVAIIQNSAHRHSAEAFYRLLLSPKGAVILGRSGLMPMPSR